MTDTYYDYYDFMSSTSYWGIGIFLFLMLLLYILIIYLDIKKRKQYSNGIADVEGKNRTYKTFASPEIIELTLKEANEGDIIEYSFDKEGTVPYIVCYKIAKKFQTSKPGVYFINVVLEQEDTTYFEIIPDKNYLPTRYISYIDEFLAKKLNAIRINPDDLITK